MNPQQIQELVLNYIKTYPFSITGWLGIKENTSYPFFGLYSIQPTIEWLDTNLSDSVPYINYDYLVKLEYLDDVLKIDIIEVISKDKLIRNRKHN